MLDKLRAFFIDKQFVSKRDFLKSLSIFKGLSNRELGYLLQMFHSRTYHEGETLFLEGDIGRALFIVESGRIELTKNGPGGTAQKLADLGPGSFFGEMALLEHLPRSANAVARERSVLLLLYRSKLEDILHHHPRVGVAIMTHLARLLSARLRKASENMVTFGAEPRAQAPA
ncbi:MAG: cyclic nucleotide-binding domain-containing protein [Elusimicrobia bacterium]|nr:cyclic nucleotide-binding domain-containing protein [Elusimicrobiota bacterium]